MLYGCRATRLRSGEAVCALQTDASERGELWQFLTVCASACFLCASGQVNCVHCKGWFEARQLAAHQTVAGADPKAPCANTTVHDGWVRINAHKACPRRRFVHSSHCDLLLFASALTLLLKTDLGHASVCPCRHMQCALCKRIIRVSHKTTHDKIECPNRQSSSSTQPPRAQLHTVRDSHSLFLCCCRQVWLSAHTAMIRLSIVICSAI